MRGFSTFDPSDRPTMINRSTNFSGSRHDPIPVCDISPKTRPVRFFLHGLMVFCCLHFKVTPCDIIFCIARFSLAQKLKLLDKALLVFVKLKWQIK
jgi:hypothetical protein